MRYHLPSKYLLIGLNRYSYDPINKLSLKNTSPLELNETLTVGKREFALVGVLEHHGRSTSTGHYVTYVKPKETWWKCNDLSVGFLCFFIQNLTFIIYGFFVQNLISYIWLFNRFFPSLQSLRLLTTATFVCIRWRTHVNPHLFLTLKKMKSW